MAGIERVIIVVLDSAGVGALPDAALYGDEGANTLGHIGDAGPLAVPNMEALGLGNIIPIRGVSPRAETQGAWGKAGSLTKGKDTTVGHWEIAGVVMNEALPTWPEGIPPDVAEQFEAAIGRKTLGRTVASGTEIIDQFGAEHVRTGFPIIYTSADSVFQIAAHEEVVPLETLYDWCKTARKMLNVGRVIARPFVGKPGSWQRTAHRHDYSLEPPQQTMLDKLVEAKLPVVGIGKISDIFAGRGITETHPITSNSDGMDKTINLVSKGGKGLVFTNLVDFDMKFGHRRDVDGYRRALEDFDAELAKLQAVMKDGDLLIITADHGCDPAFKGTDHTREYVPILAAGKRVKPGTIGTRKSFSDIAATTAELLLGSKETGSFAREILG